NGGKKNVERHGKRELNSGEIESLQTEHKSSSIRYQVVEDPSVAPGSNFPASHGRCESLLAF
ncbi:MAG: hypothetical protein J6D43_14115, partial [Pseudomonas sp.]|nr:hypothetical protein [Pseudomonas sp.]